MHYTSRYQSPLGEILLAADNIGLTGLWFYGQKYFALHLDESHEKKTCPVLGQAKIWLDLYFSGQKPDCSVPLHLRGTEFQKKYGKSFVIFLMEPRSLMEKSLLFLHKKEVWSTCLRRP